MAQAALIKLTTDVTDATTVMASAGILIDGLAERLRRDANVPGAIHALADELSASSTALAAAVAANTVAEDEVGVPPDTGNGGGEPPDPIEA